MRCAVILAMLWLAWQAGAAFFNLEARAAQVAACVPSEVQTCKGLK